MGKTLKKKSIKFIKKGNLGKEIRKRNSKKKFKSLKDRKKNNHEKDKEKNNSKIIKNNDTNDKNINNKNTKKMEEDDLNVDEFLNDHLLDDDHNDKDPIDTYSIDIMDDNDSSSEEEDEDALDPRYLMPISDLENEDDLDQDYINNNNDNSNNEEDINDTNKEIEPTLLDNDHNENMNKPLNDNNNLINGNNSLLCQKILTMELLKEMEKDSFRIGKKGLKSMYKLSCIFSYICKPDKLNTKSEFIYEIESNAVYNRLMINIYRNCHLVLQNGLFPSFNKEEINKNNNLKDTTTSSTTETNKISNTDHNAISFIIKTDLPKAIELVKSLQRQTNKIQQYKPLIIHFIQSTIHLLEDILTDEMQLFILHHLSNYIIYITPFLMIAKRLLKVCLNLWGSSENDQIRLLSFLRIRELTCIMPFPFIEIVLKAGYLTYRRFTKTISGENKLNKWKILENCVIELYNIDLSSSYQHAFIYIRQLAIDIRKLIQLPNMENTKKILNWKFISSLRLWTAILCNQNNKINNELEPLIYPLTEILHAIIRHLQNNNSLKYLPLRLHCIYFLQQLSKSFDHLFISTACLLLPIIHSTDLKKKLKIQKNSNIQKQMNLKEMIKLSKLEMEQHMTFDSIIIYLFELLNNDINIYKYTIGFVEYAFIIEKSIKKFIKETKVGKWSMIGKGFIQDLRKKIDYNKLKRDLIVDYCPKDINKMNDFLKEERMKEKLNTKEKENENIIHINYNIIIKPKLKDNEKKNGNNDVNNNKNSKKQVKLKSENVSIIAKMDPEEFKNSINNMNIQDEIQDMVWSDDEYIKLN